MQVKLNYNNLNIDFNLTRVKGALCIFLKKAQFNFEHLYIKLTNNIFT